MSPKIIEEAFNGAKKMYDANLISKDDYLRVLSTLDTNKIDVSISGNTMKKEELGVLISNEMFLISTE